MAKKFGEPGENLVQGAGRFGGAMGDMAPARSGLGRMTDYMTKRKSSTSGIDVPATGEVKSKMIIVNPKDMSKKAEPLNKEQTRARDRANAETQKQLPKTPRSRGALIDDVAEELPFSKGGSASKRADGCAIRGKTRA
jgi:hypothetical protein